MPGIMALKLREGGLWMWGAILHPIHRRLEGRGRLNYDIVSSPGTGRADSNLHFSEHSTSEIVLTSTLLAAARLLEM